MIDLVSLYIIITNITANNNNNNMIIGMKKKQTNKDEGEEEEGDEVIQTPIKWPGGCSWIKTKWINELSSILDIEDAGHNIISGTYTSIMVEPSYPSPFFGTYQECEDGGVLLSFSVQHEIQCSQNTTLRSCCCWTGKAFPGDDGFITTYLIITDYDKNAHSPGPIVNKHCFKRVISLDTDSTSKFTDTELSNHLNDVSSTDTISTNITITTTEELTSTMEKATTLNQNETTSPLYEVINM